MEKVYTAAVIGCGRIGFSLGFDEKREQPASHTMALKASKRIRIIAGCDSDSSRLENWNRFIKRAVPYRDISTLLAACHPDIFVVSVNEDSHVSIALKVIQSKPCLVILEKPVAINVSEGRKIVEAAKNFNVPVLVNHERRFALDYAVAKDFMQKIGDIQSINARLCSSLRVYSPSDESTGAYSLLHDGTHLVDVVLYLLEAITEKNPALLLRNPVLTGVYHDEKDSSIVRNLSAHYKTSVCPDVTFTISGRSKFFGFEVDVLGTTGRIHIGNGFAHFYERKESRLYTGFYSLEENRSVTVPKKTGYFSNMIQNAVDFLDNKEPIKSSLQTGMNALIILEEIKLLLKSTL